MNWDVAADSLRLWHVTRDGAAVQTAFEFVESELRQMVPASVRRRWPEDLVEEALRSFLLRLLDQPLPEDIGNLRGYLRRAFRNHCIDLYRAQNRRREMPLDQAPAGWDLPEDDESPEAVLKVRTHAQDVERALRQLETADRIVLVLEYVPASLSDQDIAWLSDRLGKAPPEVRSLIAAASDMHEFTRIFDPGDDDPEDPKVRRKRMERFRRRRARAREKLLALLGGVV
jgi:DNA-directed RNA polymerase specialized sigma24 family protein